MWCECRSRPRPHNQSTCRASWRRRCSLRLRAAPVTMLLGASGCVGGNPPMPVGGCDAAALPEVAADEVVAEVVSAIAKVPRKLANKSC